jgi:hypothetical protein
LGPLLNSRHIGIDTGGGCGSLPVEIEAPIEVITSWPPGHGRYQLDLYQVHHQHHLMALDPTKLELYDLELDLYAMDQIYHVQVGAPMDSLNPDHQVMKEYQLGPLPVPPPTSFDVDQTKLELYQAIFLFT